MRTLINDHWDYDYDQDHPLTDTLILPWIMLFVGAFAAKYFFEGMGQGGFFHWYIRASFFTTTTLLLVCVFFMFTDYLSEKFEAGPWYIYLLLGFFFALFSPIIFFVTVLLIFVAWFLGKYFSVIYSQLH